MVIQQMSPGTLFCNHSCGSLGFSSKNPAPPCYKNKVRREAHLAKAKPSTANEVPEDYKLVQRNLALELVRVTEAAALSAGRWLGKGDKKQADLAAVDMMRRVLNTVNMNGIVKIGEGDEGQVPMLYRGERLGSGTSPEMEIAVNPLDGTTLIAQGRNGAVSVIALAERGCLFDPGPCMYMEKLATGPDVSPHMVNLNYSIARNLQAVAVANNKPISDVTVVILDRPRHLDIVKQCRAAGARIRLISDGDVGAVIEVAQRMTSSGAPADVMFGTGGTAEGVIAAAALKCMGGNIQGRLKPRNEDERQLAEQAGYDLSKVYNTEDLCRGEQVFFAATGVSDGNLLQGVRYYRGGATTNSIVMRASSGTVRMIKTQHKWSRPSVTNINPHLNTAK